jgi:RNA polymerase sigma-70 factor (ECF subfamily)
MDLSEEKELVRQAQKDPDAFAELYDQYYPKIFGYVLRRTGNLEAAQDITSETFFKALR